MLWHFFRRALPQVEMFSFFWRASVEQTVREFPVLKSIRFSPPAIVYRICSCLLSSVEIVKIAFPRYALINRHRTLPRGYLSRNVFCSSFF